ncbi:MAG: ribose-phosphate pyrophosphokinase [Myxococcaceae bacterium]|nr:ribose-phosphate pyrophosphokinase [Myxococcaceae bacterium]
MVTRNRSALVLSSRAVPPVLLSGSAHPALAAALAKELGQPLGPCGITRFPDGELEIDVQADVRGRDVWLVQPTSPPVGEHLLELTLLSDACRRAGATSITAIVSYLGYARQDRRETGREPLGSRVVAELLAAGRIDRMVCLDLHSRAVEGCFLQPVEHASAVDALVARLRDLPKPLVVVSPDLGAVKRAEAFAKLLGVNVAVVHKQRLSGSDVSAMGVVGEVKGMNAVVVDDMISTAGTVCAAINAVTAAGALPGVTVAATHGLFVGPALERLKACAPKRVVVTDSLPPPVAAPFPLEVVPCAPVLADVLRRL